jgi:hypothetical protein
MKRSVLVDRKQSMNRVEIYQYRQSKQLRSDDVMNNFPATLSYGRSVESTKKVKLLYKLLELFSSHGMLYVTSIESTAILT